MSADPALPSTCRFLEGGGAASRMIVERNWTGHPLGPPETWPEGLQTALSLLLNSPESMILAWGPELHFFYNETYFPLLGPRVHGAMGERFADVWADGWEQARPIIDEAMAGRPKRFVNLPWKLATDRGAEDTWWTFSYSRILDRDGAPAGLFIVTNETTETVVGAAERLATDTRNRQILDSATDHAVIATDLAGRVTRWNEGASRIFGWSEAEMIDRPLDPLFTAGDLAEDRIRADSGRSPRTGQEERWHLRRNGERFWASGEMTTLRDTQGIVSGYVRVLRDHTEQRRAGEALHRSRQELAAANALLERDVVVTAAERDRLWETSPDLLLVIDFAGTIRRANQAWHTLLGHRPADMIGRNVTRFVLPDDLAGSTAALEQAGQDQLPYSENRLMHADGSFRWFSWVARPAGDAIYATGRHITAEKESRAALRATEEQLRQSQKMEAVGQLTGGVAHDFNNLLTVIRGSIDLLRRPDLSEDRRRRYLDAIADTADRATRLTSQLLAFARRQALKPEVFDAGESVRSVADMVRTLAGSRIVLSIATADAPSLVNADRSQFDTAIVNMAVNARDAMQGAGTLAIRVDRVAGMPAMRAHPAVPGDFVTVSLADSGSGIAEDQIDRIFEPFFTTKSVGEGTGLGLSQVFGFAKQSGGDILVNSRAGEGATFTLYLPRAAAPAAFAAEDAPDEVATPVEGACVLVVEDNADVGTFATQALAELGYDAVLAKDGAGALRELAQCGDCFDVIFSDVMMPGMSGIELAQEVRRQYPRLPVVLTSGYSTVLAKTGCDGFELLHKPYSIDELSRVLRKVAPRHGTADDRR